MSLNNGFKLRDETNKNVHNYSLSDVIKVKYRCMCDSVNFTAPGKITVYRAIKMGPSSSKS